MVLIASIMLACGMHQDDALENVELGELEQSIRVPEYYGWTGANNLQCDPNVDQLCYLPYPRGTIGTQFAYTRWEYIGGGYQTLET